MQLPPVGPLPAGLPVSSAGAPSVRQGIEHLIHDGVEILGPRKLGPVGLGTKKLIALDEIANRVGRDVLQLILPGTVSLALRDPDTLRAVASFKAGQPVEGLARKELFLSLKQLAEQGWRFHSPQGEIGPFGAYNNLGHEVVQARRGEATVELHRAEAAQHMAAFYDRTDSLAAGLERQGYQFWGQSGKPECAFQVSKHSSIGKAGQPWIRFDPRDEELQQARLARMEELLARGVPLEEARERLSTWVEARGLATPEAVSACPRQGASPHRLLELAERLTAFPETREQAELALRSVAGGEHQREVLDRLLGQPRLPLPQMVLELLPPWAPMPVVKTLLEGLPGHDPARSALALAGRLVEPALRFEAVQTLMRSEGDPESLLPLVRRADPRGGAQLAAHYLEEVARRHPERAPAANMTRAVLEESPPERTESFLYSFRSQRGPQQELLPLAVSLAHNCQLEPPGWDAMWKSLAQAPELAEVGAIGSRLCGLSAPSSKRNRLCTLLLSNVGSPSGREKKLLNEVRWDSSLIEPVTEAIWAGVSPRALADEGRRVVSLSKDPLARANLTVAILERRDREPLQSALELLESGDWAFSLTDEQERDLQGLREPLRLMMSKKSTARAIEEQEGRVVVGGTFVRKRR